MLLTIYYMALRLSMYKVHPFSIAFYISVVLGLFVLALFLLYYKRLDKAGRYVFYYVLVSFIIPIGVLVAGDTDGNRWWRIGTIIYLLQFLLLSGFYYQVIKKTFFKRLIAALMIIVPIIFCLDFFWWEGPTANIDIFGAVRHSLLITYAIVFTLQIMSDKELITRGIPAQSLPGFWFNAGVLVFSCGSLLLSSSSNHFYGWTYYWMLTLILLYAGGCVQFIFFYIGLRKVKQQTRRKSHETINISK